MGEVAVPGIFVVVVDDDEVMRELLSALLEAEGHRVTKSSAVRGGSAGCCADRSANAEHGCGGDVAVDAQRYEFEDAADRDEWQ